VLVMVVEVVYRKKKRQTEQSWREHDPRQAAVPWAAKQRLAAIKRTLAVQAKQIERHIYVDSNFPDRLLIDCIRKRGIARQRALKLAHAALPGAQLSATRDCLDIRWLAPRQPWLANPRTPGESQDNITVHIALLHCLNGLPEFWAAWLLEASDHACGRYLQYADGDLREALFAASAAFAAADVEQTVRNAGSLYLPAGGGVFACDLIKGLLPQTGEVGVVTYCRSRTWLAADMLDDQQIPLRPADSPDRSVATFLLAGIRDPASERSPGFSFPASTAPGC